MTSSDTQGMWPNEEILVQTRPSWRSFSVFIFGFLLCTIGPFVTENPPLSPTSGLVFGAVFALIILRRWSNLYTLTNQRIMVRGGLIERATYGITLANVSGVEMHQGVVLRFLKAGHVLVRSHVANEENIIIYGVPDPDAFKRNLEQLVADARAGSGTDTTGPPTLQ